MDKNVDKAMANFHRRLATSFGKGVVFSAKYPPIYDRIPEGYFPVRLVPEIIEPNMRGADFTRRLVEELVKKYDPIPYRNWYVLPLEKAKPIPNRKDLLVNFVKSRETARIIHDNDQGPPYSDDPIVNFYRYSNIRRRDDRISRWLVKNYYPLFKNKLWFVAAIARYINWPDTLEKLIPAISPWNEELAVKILESRRFDQVFGGAYTIYIKKGEKSKTEFIPKMMSELLTHFYEIEEAMKTNSIANVTKALCVQDGVNSFMAGQIVADLTYIPGQLDHAVDLYTWAPLGPGSQRGMNWYKGLDLDKKWKEEEFVRELLKVKEFLPEMGLTLHDVQNTFCEFGKYMKGLFTGEIPEPYYPVKLPMP
jgi:hypothetical protein